MRDVLAADEDGDGDGDGDDGETDLTPLLSGAEPHAEGCGIPASSLTALVTEVADTTTDVLSAYR